MILAYPSFVGNIPPYDILLGMFTGKSYVTTSPIKDFADHHIRVQGTGTGKYATLDFFKGKMGNITYKGNSECLQFVRQLKRTYRGIVAEPFWTNSSLIAVNVLLK